MQTMAGALAKSGLFGVKTSDQALALMLVAQAEGRHPGSVASDYHIIQGRASLKSDSMLARFQQAGGRVEWHDPTNCWHVIDTYAVMGYLHLDSSQADAAQRICDIYNEVMP
jgi:hypothetical protein